MFATESEKSEYIRMALEQRLGAIIGSLEDLNRATVTLSIPPRSNAVITANKQYPSAAVVVYPKNDRKLSSKQIQGITNIVKASLPGLTEENVLIADNLGFPLIAEDLGVDAVDDALRKLVFKNELERDIKNKISDLLTPAFNIDGFSAVVNMTLNFDSRVSEETVYTPSDEGDNSGVKAYEENKEATGFQTDVGGVAGVEVGADNTYPTGELMGNGQWSEIDNSATYLVDTRKEQVEKAGYVIDGLSIAVVIYQDYLSDVQRDELVNLVGQAGGVNPLAFNDVITVANFPKFGESEFDDSPDDAIIGNLTLVELIILGAVVLGVIIILAVILFVMSRNNAKKRKRFERMVMESGKFGDVPDGADNLLNIGIDGLPLDVQSLTDDSVETKEGVIRREIAQFAKQSPEIVASLLKNWMKETE
jgi:flagellar M-ring protein FliF